MLKRAVCVAVAIGWTAALSAQSVPPQTVAQIRASTEKTAEGSDTPDVVIVEYLDYNCPYCQKTAPQLQKLLQADAHVRLILKEWPIFGDASVYAARSALAASWQGKFAPTHDILIGAKRDLDQNTDVDAVLRTVPGLDLVRLAADRRAHAGEIDAILARTVRETHTLGVQGTPVFLIGSHLITSALTLPQLQQQVASVRSEHPPTRP